MSVRGENLFDGAVGDGVALGRSAISGDDHPGLISKSQDGRGMGSIKGRRGEACDREGLWPALTQKVAERRVVKARSGGRLERQFGLHQGGILCTPRPRRLNLSSRNAV